MNMLRVSVCLVALVACKGSPFTSSLLGGDSGAATTSASVTHGTAPVTASASTGPLDFDEARYQKWVAFQKELNPAMQKGIAQVLQPVAGKKEETVVGAAADLRTANANVDEMKKELDGIRSKYGFSDAEDSRIWEALAEVMAGDNATIKPMIDQMKQTAQSDGPGKEAAAKFLKDQADQDQKRLAKAKDKFGEKAIDVLLAHRPELQPLFDQHTAAVLQGYTGGKQ